MLVTGIKYANSRVAEVLLVSHLLHTLPYIKAPRPGGICTVLEEINLLCSILPVVIKKPNTLVSGKHPTAAYIYNNVCFLHKSYADDTVFFKVTNLKLVFYMDTQYIFSCSFTILVFLSYSLIYPIANDYLVRCGA